METGELIYEKYMRHLVLHQRSPWNTTGKENWVQKTLNDKKDKLSNNPEVSNRTNQFQTQVVIERGNPLLERIERSNPLLEPTREPYKMEGKRPVPRRSIHVFFTKKLFNSDRTEQPVVETSKTQTRSSDDSKSLHVEMAHDRTGQPVVETNTENVPDGCPTRSCHESISFNVGDETIRDRTGQPRCKPWRTKSWANNAEQGEHWLPNSTFTTFRCEACWELTRSWIG